MAAYTTAGCVSLILIVCFQPTTSQVSDAHHAQGRDCSDIWEMNNRPESGIYTIQPDGANTTYQVFCEMTESEGWTVFQKRNGEDGLLFSKTWSEYEQGFGNLRGEHWLGLHLLHLLTTQKKRQCKLRILLQDFSNNEAFAEYGSFRVEQDNYTLYLSDYSGNAGDSFKGDSRSGNDQYGSPFSTQDKPHDQCSPRCIFGDIMYKSCSARYQSGWWFSSCGTANLNGVYRTPPRIKSTTSVIWPTWKENESLKSSKMAVNCH